MSSSIRELSDAELERATAYPRTNPDRVEWACYFYNTYGSKEVDINEFCNSIHSLERQYNTRTCSDYDDYIRSFYKAMQYSPYFKPRVITRRRQS